MKPAQVLDYQSTLRTYLRTTDWHRFMDGYLGVRPARPDMPPAGVSRGGPSPLDGKGWCEREVSTLEMAHAFHVEAEMIPLVRHASAGLDEDFTWTKELFPTERGFLMWSDGMVGTDVRGVVSIVHAITWRWGGYNGRAGVWLTYYGLTSDTRDAVMAQWFERDPARLREFGPLMTGHVEFIPWGSHLGPAQISLDADDIARYAVDGPTIEPGAAFDAPSRWVYATLALMSQTVTDVAEESLPRGLARRMAKKRIPPRVVVVRLRRHEGARRDGESAVEWAHRWVVRGHWRKQPCGPGLSETKVIWIAPFVKGPEGKPLVISRKVYDLAQ